MMLGYACLQWAAGPISADARAVDFGNDLYFSAATMTTEGPASLSAQTTLRPCRSGDRLGQRPGGAGDRDRLPALPLPGLLTPRGDGLPARRPRRLAAERGAARIRSTRRDGWPRLNRYLSSWETWVAELMETHLAYPVLAYFRSQHVNQNWLSAMCTVLDACAFTSRPPRRGRSTPRASPSRSRATRSSTSATASTSSRYRAGVDRLPRGGPGGAAAPAGRSGVAPGRDLATVKERLERIARLYEPYVNALGERLELGMPQWLAPESPTDNWRTTAVALSRSRPRAAPRWAQAPWPLGRTSTSLTLTLGGWPIA